MKFKRSEQGFVDAVTVMVPSFHAKQHREAVGVLAASFAERACRRRTGSGRFVWDMRGRVIRDAIRRAEADSDLYRSCGCGPCKSIEEVTINL